MLSFFKLLFLLFDFFFNIKKNDIFFFLESFFHKLLVQLKDFKLLLKTQIEFGGFIQTYIFFPAEYFFRVSLQIK